MRKNKFFLGLKKVSEVRYVALCYSQATIFGNVKSFIYDCNVIVYNIKLKGLDKDQLLTQLEKEKSAIIEFFNPENEKTKHISNHPKKRASLPSRIMRDKVG